MDELKSIKLIKKSEFARNMINTWRQNLVNAEIDVIFYRNQELIVKTPQLGQVNKGLADAILKQKQATNILRACEQELEVCLREEAEEEKKKN